MVGQPLAAESAPPHPQQVAGLELLQLRGGAGHPAIAVPDVVLAAGQRHLPPVEISDVVRRLFQIAGDVAGHEDGVLFISDEGEELL